MKLEIHIRTRVLKTRFRSRVFKTRVSCKKNLTYSGVFKTYSDVLKPYSDVFLQKKFFISTGLRSPIVAFLSPIVTFYRPIAAFFAIYENRVSKTRFSAQFFFSKSRLKNSSSIWNSSFRYSRCYFSKLFWNMTIN